ncbi:putative lipase protein, partial [Podospora conica]
VTAGELNDFRLFAQYSAAAFCNDANAPGQKIACAKDFCPLVEVQNTTTITSFSGPITDIRGFIAADHTKRAIIVSFRGSVSVRNWIVDFIFLQVPCTLSLGCLAHAGFLSAWKEISTPVLRSVAAARAAHPSYKIIVTGHSLGAAVATLAAGHLRKDGKHADVDLYTFGSPRVGNYFLAKTITDQPGREYRVTHAADPVPRLPPIVLNYAHTAPEYWLQSTEPGVGDTQVCGGYFNVKCNAGEEGFDMSLHSLYFRQVNGCGQGDTTPWRRSGAEGVSDGELEAIVAEWGREDREFAKGLEQ